MTGRKDNRTSVFFDQQIEAAKNFASEGAHLKALEIYETLFAEARRSQALYDGAGRSATNLILDDAWTDEWPRARRDALYRHLILQTERFGASPAFHFQIASHSGTAKEMLPRAGAELAPILTALRAEGLRDRDLLLMILLLRAPLHATIDQADLSAWHLDLLPEFEVEDMALPYNAMFDKIHFARNVADISGLIERTQPDVLARRFPPWKMLLFHWITGSPRLDRILPELISEWLRKDDLSDEDVRALRSLALRLHVMERLPGSPGDGLDQFLTLWCPMHRPGPIDPVAGSAISKLASKQWQAVNAALRIARRRAPFLKLGTRRPRIALCVSGQLRGYTRAFPTWQETILRDVDYDVFLHSWEKIGRSGAEPYRAYLPFAGQAFGDAWRVHAHRVGMEEMHARYPLLFAALQQGGTVTPAELSAFYSTDHVVLEDDSGPAFAGWSNGRKMHYKVNAVHKLIGDRLSDYDLVLRVRPDKQLGLVAFAWRDMLAATKKAPVIFADSGIGHQYANLLIGDQVALGAPAPMTAYADTLDLVPRMATQSLHACGPDYIGHVSLALTCWHAGIDVQRLPVKMGNLLEAEPMSTPDITAALEADAAGRMDHMDEALLSAIRTDLGGA